MQLILETEAAADITLKMTTVEESLDTNIKDSIEILKNDICNGNKENIESQKKNIANAVGNIDSDQKEHSDNQSEMLTDVQDINLKLDNCNDIDLLCTTEEVDEELEIKNSCVDNEKPSAENNESNCLNNSINKDSNKQKCAENVLLEETEADAGTILVNNVPTQDNGNIDNKDINMDTEYVNSDEKENTENNTVIEVNSNNTEIETNDSNSLDVEMKLDNDKTVNKTSCVENSVDAEDKKSLIASQVEEDISEMALEVDKTVSEMVMQIEDDNMLNSVDSPDEKVSDEAILIDDAESENVASKKEATPDSIIPLDSECDVEVLPETKQKTTISSNQNKVENVVLDDKNRDDKPDSTAPVIAEQCNTENSSFCKLNDSETDANEINEPENIKVDDDDVIPIEVDQDSVMKSVISETDNGVSQLENTVKDDAQEVPDIDETVTETDSEIKVKDNSEKKPENIDLSDDVSESVDNKRAVLVIKDVSKDKEQITESTVKSSLQSVKVVETKLPQVLKLSNTLDILSDDDEDQPPAEPPKPSEPPKPEEPPKAAETTPEKSTDKQCINIEDDDDIMLIDEDTDLKNNKEPIKLIKTNDKKEKKTDECKLDLENQEALESKQDPETVPKTDKDPAAVTSEVKASAKELDTVDTIKETKEEIKEPQKPLLPDNFLKTCKKNLADMTRDELEEFCILKIVESIVDRSNLGEIKSKLKTMTQNIEEQKKKAMTLTKQNRDLQLVLKSVQEEQKKKPDSAITPLRITRSVGMQVFMTEKVGNKKKPNTNMNSVAPSNVNRNVRTPNQSPRVQRPAGNQQIPVPRLVPAAANPVAKSPMTQSSPVNNQVKASQFNGARMSPPVQKAEKRAHNRIQSVTVDLTDDEPPAKITPRSSPAPPVRLVSPQNLLTAPRQQLTTSLNSPRKVYIPISGPQGQSIRPGQTIMLKSVPPPGVRQRAPAPNMTRGSSQSLSKRVPNNRHPAPLPDAMKQYQPPNWKALPPAPDLKLSKVENGIVISWKIEGYQEDSYEEIASYQLYAYQETSSPPSTALWKKIGDVKALPLPMACTLTQFMAGFKYYFAVRAVDIRSRLGPFSLPGSILLLNKM